MKRFPLLTASAIAPVLSFSVQPALANDAAIESNGPAVEQILVIGHGASLNNAIEKQRQADAIKSIISADAIQQLPNDNVAEAVQSLPGITIERDQGEGRFVSVRGLSPNFNSVSINGAAIPAPNADSRAVALDVIPAELVQTLSVTKAATPDMDANALGGAIEVDSLSGLDHKRLFYTTKVEAGVDSHQDETSPKLSGAIAKPFQLKQGQLGVALAASWHDRDFGSDNIETGGNWEFEDQTALAELEQRDYTINRERFGLGLNIDYHYSPNAQYYLRTLRSEFTDTETRQAAGIEFNDAQPINTNGEAAAWRELKERTETQEIESYTLGGKWLKNDWQFELQAGQSESSEDTPEHIAGAVFETSDNLSAARFTSTKKPVISTVPDFFAGSAYELAEIEWAEQITTDTNRYFKADISRNYTFGELPSAVKFGVKSSLREKDNDTNIWVLEDFADNGISDDALLLTPYLGSEVDYSLGLFGPAINSEPVVALANSLVGDDFFDAQASRLEDFTVNEDTDAAYLMNTTEWPKTKVIAGVRYQKTQFKARGQGLDEGEFETIAKNVEEDHWLPALHIKYAMSDDTQLRAAWTNSVVRPTFEQLMPSFVFDGDEAEFGNPELEAQTSQNLDFGLEHFMGRASLFSAFVFYKDIENYVYETNVASAEQWQDFSEAITYVNGDDAKLMGLEFSWSQQFNHLPKPWNHLLAGANFTITQSETTVSDGEEVREIDLPYQSPRIANLMLGWENEKLSLRASANYKAAYLQEVAVLDGKDYDLYQDDQTFVDLSAHYFVNDRLRINLEAKNLTDQSYYIYTRNDQFNAQYEEYGPTYKLGITWTSP